MTDTTVGTVGSLPASGSHPLRRLRILIPGGEGHLGRILARRFSASGHLGRILARRFSASGHSVVTLTRSFPRASGSADSAVQLGKPASWRTVHWNGTITGPWTEALEGTDVLINLAGRSVNCRYHAKNRDEILRSRVESTTILGNAIRAMRRPPTIWLNASTATIYRHVYDREMDEMTGELGGNEPDAPSSWRFSIEVARQWEQAFFGSDTPQTRKVALRAAMVMSLEPGGVFSVMLRLVRMGLGGAWGSGSQFMSWIHEVDFVRAVEFLIARDDISGPVNLSAPSPLPNSQFMSELRDAWGVIYGLPASTWMLAAGASVMRTETELLLKSRRVVPAVLRQHGFEFSFPEWSEAAQELVKRWREGLAVTQIRWSRGK